MQALILAGGRGTRMRPLTDIRPKPLLYLPGGVLLDYVLAHVRLLPIREIGLVLQYEGEEVARYLAPHPHEITLIPQRPPLTVLGALASAIDWVHEPTLVLHADTYLSASLHYLVQPFMRGQAGAPTFLVDTANPSSYRSTRLARAGAYVLPPEVFRIAAKIAEADTLLALTAELAVRGIETAIVPARGWQRTIIEPSDLLAVNRHLLVNWHETAHPVSANAGYDPMTFSWIAPDARADERRLGLYVTIGERAVIESSRLHNCLVFPGVSLANAEEENAILTETRNELLRIYAPNGSS
ncbi:MAG: NTP transferase domain-containing protein [Ardenticatenaceae bacterium]|nr:NTP transferase domain-containing protein [Ardenticatenaceae bacterium]